MVAFLKLLDLLIEVLLAIRLRKCHDVLLVAQLLKVGLDVLDRLLLL